MGAAHARCLFGDALGIRRRERWRSSGCGPMQRPANTPHWIARIMGANEFKGSGAGGGRTIEPGGRHDDGCRLGRPALQEGIKLDQRVDVKALPRLTLR